MTSTSTSLRRWRPSQQSCWCVRAGGAYVVIRQLVTRHPAGGSSVQEPSCGRSVKGCGHAGNAVALGGRAPASWPWLGMAVPCHITPFLGMATPQLSAAAAVVCTTTTTLLSPLPHVAALACGRPCRCCCCSCSCPSLWCLCRCHYLPTSHVSLLLLTATATAVSCPSLPQVSVLLLNEHTSWLKGVTLLTTYMCLAAGFWQHKDQKLILAVDGHLVGMVRSQVQANLTALMASG